MKKKNNFQEKMIVMLAILIIVMSIGFASITSQLTVYSGVKFKSASYNVSFDRDSYELTFGSNATTELPTISGASINYGVTLSEPGEYLEFTLNLVNEGTLDVYLSSIIMGGLTAEQKNYIRYTVTYNSVECQETTENINLLIPKETGTIPVKVKVEYIPASEDLLPTENVNLNLICALNFNV